MNAFIGMHEYAEMYPFAYMHVQCKFRCIIVEITTGSNKHLGAALGIVLVHYVVEKSTNVSSGWPGSTMVRCRYTKSLLCNKITRNFSKANIMSSVAQTIFKH